MHHRVEPYVTLVVGGAGSGKSEAAESLAARHFGQPVTYVATAPAEDPDDPSWAARVAAHVARRPPHWETLELATPESLPAVLREIEGVALVDSLGTWVAALEGFEVDARPLAGVLGDRRGSGRSSIVVSDEVGLGVHPLTQAGRHFREALALVNRAVSEVADEVLFVLAGRVMRMGDSIVPLSFEAPPRAGEHPSDSPGCAGEGS